ncbi:MAG: DUF3386 domain-containing protein [Planctomycetales bacterium]
MQRLLIPFWMLGCVASLIAAEDAEKPRKVDPGAAKIMRVAHVARSSWADDFPGFSAAISVTIDGKQTAGKVRVSSDGEVQLELPKGEAADWATRTMESVVMHRLAVVHKEYSVSFADDVKDHPLGRLIRFHDGTHNLYRIKDDLITEVHREGEHFKFTITVSAADRNPENKTLPKHFNVSFWNPKTNELTRNEDYHEDWIQVGKVDVPQRRLLIRTGKDGRRVLELRLSDHQLLPAKNGK